MSCNAVSVLVSVYPVVHKRRCAADPYVSDTSEAYYGKLFEGIVGQCDFNRIYKHYYKNGSGNDNFGKLYNPYRISAVEEISGT